MSPLLATTDSRLGHSRVNIAVTRERSSEQSTKLFPPDLAEVSLKTGLVLRPLDSESVNRLFAEIEKYDYQERVETFEYLKHALNETRDSLGAEPCYTTT